MSKENNATVDLIQTLSALTLSDNPEKEKETRKQKKGQDWFFEGSTCFVPFRGTERSSLFSSHVPSLGPGLAFLEENFLSEDKRFYVYPHTRRPRVEDFQGDDDVALKKAALKAPCVAEMFRWGRSVVFHEPSGRLVLVDDRETCPCGGACVIPHMCALSLVGEEDEEDRENARSASSNVVPVEQADLGYTAYLEMYRFGEDLLYFSDRTDEEKELVYRAMDHMFEDLKGLGWDMKLTSEIMCPLCGFVRPEQGQCCCF